VLSAAIFAAKPFLHRNSSVDTCRGVTQVNR
jgi:hypothetical protein